MPYPRPEPSPIRCCNEVWQVLAGEGDLECWEDCRSEEDARIISQADILYWELHSAPVCPDVAYRLNELADVLEQHAIDLAGGSSIATGEQAPSG